VETELAAVSEYLNKIEDEALPSPSRCEGCLREANRMGLVGENSGLWREKNVCVSHVSVSSKSLWHLCALFVNTGFSMKRNQKLETHPSFLEVDVVGNFLKVQATYSPLVLPSKGLIWGSRGRVFGTFSKLCSRHRLHGYAALVAVFRRTAFSGLVFAR